MAPVDFPRLRLYGQSKLSLYTKLNLIRYYWGSPVRYGFGRPFGNSRDTTPYSTQMILKFSTIVACATTMLVGAQNDPSKCNSLCTSVVTQKGEAECASWREVLPRPELYNTCLHGYRHGASTACLDECEGRGDAGGYGTHSSAACEEFRQRRPREIGKACQAGFFSGVKLAEEEARLLLDPALKAKLQEEAKQAEEAAAAAATARKLAEDEAKQRELEAQRQAEETRKLAEEKQRKLEEENQRKLEAQATDDLQQARDEARKAYEEERSNVL